MFQLSTDPRVGGRGQRIHTHCTALVRPADVGDLPSRRRPQLGRLCLQGIHHKRDHRYLPPFQARRTRLWVSRLDKARYEVE